MHTGCASVADLPIAVELRDHPQLTGQPLLLMGAGDRKDRVYAVSPEAAALGIQPGMLEREALSRSLDVQILTARPLRYADTAQAMIAALDMVSPLLEAGAPGTVYLGLAGLQGIYPTAQALNEAVCERVRRATGLLPALGIGPGKFPALVAARHAAPGRVHVLQDAEAVRDYLAPLPVDELPVAFETRRRLHLFGLHTIGAVAALPLHALQAQFGPEGRMLWQMARGSDPSPLIPRPAGETALEQFEFAPPTVSLDALVHAVETLLARLLRHQAVQGRTVRQVEVRLALENGLAWERRFTFREATSDRTSLLIPIKSWLTTVTPAAPVEMVVLALGERGSERGKQLGLFSGNVRRVLQLAESVRQLRARYGASPLAHIVEVEPWSRIPERRYALLDYDP
jgi:DNA polymerase-4/protein ImuB